MRLATHADYVAYSERVGVALPSLPQTVNLLAAQGVRLGNVLYVTVNVNTPPHVGDGNPPRCVHCGFPVQPEQHLRAHAVEWFEQARHPDDHQLLRLQVRHCDRCIGGPGCSRDEPGGYCHPLTEEG